MIKTPPRVLVSPLDWGLGHATRCIPVIRALAGEGVETMISASGNGHLLLKNEFPNHKFIEIPGTRIKYPGNGNMASAMMLQSLGIFRSILKEHRLLNTLISEYGITHVIADNRYGLYSKKAKTAFITHQVHIKGGTNFKFIEPLLFRLNKYFIHRFDELWIPDIKPPGNLSGELSDVSNIKIPVKYIGMLSRFPHSANTGTKIYDYIALLSGPEPQRTIFEKKVRAFFELSGKKCLLIMGQPASTIDSHNGEVSIKASITDDELMKILHPGTILISRPGYSTLMDMAVLGHRNLWLVPTPGQTEQEYLAARLRDQGYTVTGQNDPFPPTNISAGNALNISYDPDQIKNIIRNFLV